MADDGMLREGARYLPVGQYSAHSEVGWPHILLGFMNYPSDVRSAHHFAQVIGDDAAGIESGNFEKHSAIAELILNNAMNRQKQAELSGHIALAMMELRVHNRRVSLTRAIHSIEKFAGDTDAEFKYGLPLSKRSIRAAFSEFGNVSHFWAAMIAFPDLYLGSIQSQQGFSEFLAVSASIQGFLADHLDPQTAWNPWRVPPEFAAPESVIVVPRLKEEFLDHADAYRKSGGAYFLPPP